MSEKCSLCVVFTVSRRNVDIVLNHVVVFSRLEMELNLRLEDCDRRDCRRDCLSYGSMLKHWSSSSFSSVFSFSEPSRCDCRKHRQEERPRSPCSECLTDKPERLDHSRTTSKRPSELLSQLDHDDTIRRSPASSPTRTPTSFLKERTTDTGSAALSLSTTTRTTMIRHHRRRTVERSTIPASHHRRVRERPLSSGRLRR